MHGRALSPSPIAIFLLGLAERGADGSVEVGGCQVLLRKGQVVDVRPAEDDGDLAAFLLDSGRVAPEPLERCRARAEQEGLSFEEVLIRQRLLSSEAVREVRRGLWLDRLVRGIAAASERGDAAPALQAGGALPEAPSTSLVTFVLDALERRAGDEDAGQVGARAQHRLEWLPTPHTERAARWARFDGRETRGPVAGLLKIEPAAASRVAALLRAGLARIVSPDRTSVTPPAAPASPASSSSSPPRTTLPPEPPAPSIAPEPPPATFSVELIPALFPLFDGEPQLHRALPRFPEPVEPLNDPLDALERRITALEQTNAPGPERAEAWRRFGEAWETRFGSLEEAARAYREAAAADAEDRLASERAADRCAALGQTDLAVAYGRASVSAAADEPERAAALWRYALLCRRADRASEALGALRAARTARPDDPEPLALSVHVWRELDRKGEAAEAAAEAAAELPDPDRALALSALALALAPHETAHAEAYADRLAARGRIDAAIAVRSEAVRRTNDPDARRSLLLAAAEQAELANRPRIAAALLTRAFDAEPHVDLFYDPLDADLAQADAPLERAVLLEEIAAAAIESQASYYVRAAEARSALSGDSAWEIELWARALELTPEDEAGWRTVRERAAPRVLADVIERAVLRGRWNSVEPQRRALEELAQLAEGALSEPARAAWAWERIQALGFHDPAPGRALARLAPELAAHRARRKDLEDAGPSRALADHLRGDPDRRRQALRLYGGMLDDSDARAACEELSRLLGEEDTRLLERCAAHAEDPAERARLRLRRAALAALAGRFDEAALACRSILDELPSHREASLRLLRAASRLGDPELLREALGSEVALAASPPAQARLLCALAVELEDADRRDEALSCAEAALEADPQSAEAALVMTRHLEMLEAPEKAFERVRALFGDAPPILEAWARIARASGARTVMLEALDAWARVAPYDSEPWAQRLSALAPDETADSLFLAIEGALAPERVVPSLAPKVTSALTLLAELGDIERAATLAIDAADALGPNGAPLRELANQLARASGDAGLRRDALERRLAVPSEEARLALLDELASLHREANDRAAEARTHLRVLAIQPHESRSLARLEALYTETGEIDRLMAALALSLDGAEPPMRIEPLRKLAAASFTLRGDLDRAERYLLEAWTPALESEAPLFESAAALVALGRGRRAVEHLCDAGRTLPPHRAAAVFLRAVQTALKEVDDSRLALSATLEGLEYAPSSGHLLLAFEQLAMELREVEAAEHTYQRLFDRAMGPHGRSAIAYRRARWLEHVGAGALDAYLEAFTLEPKAAAYASIERLARERGDLEALARAALLLAAHAAHPAARANMTREAARILERELDADERAFEVLFELWETGDPSVEDDLLRLANATRRSDAARGDAAFERVLDELRRRADDAWMSEMRARILVRQARVHALGRRDLDAARATIGEAIEAAGEDGDVDLVAEIHLEAASWCFEAGAQEDANAHVRDALRARPANETARALASQLGLDLDTVTGDRSEPQVLRESKEEDEAAASHSWPPAMGANGGAAMTAMETGGAADLSPPPPPADASLVDVESHEDVSHVALGVNASAVRSSPVPTRVLVPPAMGRWRPASPPQTSDDAAALEREASSIAARSPERAIELLRAAVALEPDRLSALRALGALGETHPAGHGARALLALIEPELAPAQRLAPPARSRLRDLLRDPALAALDDIWALLWEQAAPLFREPHASALEPNAQVTRVATTPEARAYVDALDALGRDELPAFYLDRSGSGLVIRLTVPPCLVGGPDFADGEPAMRFALGRALALSEPESLLVATLTAPRRRMVSAAVAAAFGPADGGDSVPREAAALASELWRTIPPRAQGGIRELLVAAGERWSDDGLIRDAVEAKGLRAGLIACGDLGVAVRGVCDADAELSSLRLDTEAGLSEALGAESIARLVRFALSL